MKNKKNIYILLPVVLLIWGMVIYRFFSFSVTEVQDIQIQNDILKPIAVKQRDTFEIDVNYRDPFLGKIYLSESNKTKNVRRKRESEQQILWPQIIYKGIVSDTKNKKKVFMLVINGQTYLMKEKETEQEMTLKSGNKESIVVKYKGDLTKIFLQE